MINGVKVFFYHIIKNEISKKKKTKPKIEISYSKAIQITEMNT